MIAVANTITKTQTVSSTINLPATQATVPILPSEQDRDVNNRSAKNQVLFNASIEFVLDPFSNSFTIKVEPRVTITHNSETAQNLWFIHHIDTCIGLINSKPELGQKCEYSPTTEKNSTFAFNGDFSVFVPFVARRGRARVHDPSRCYATEHFDNQNLIAGNLGTIVSGSLWTTTLAHGSNDNKKLQGTAEQIQAMLVPEALMFLKKQFTQKWSAEGSGENITGTTANFYLEVTVFLRQPVMRTEGLLAVSHTFKQLKVDFTTGNFDLIAVPESKFRFIAQP